MKVLLAKVVLLAVILPFSSANAASFDLSYTLESGQVLTASIEGTLQADGNTVVVTAVADPVFDGMPAPSLPLVSSLFTEVGGGPSDPLLSLDGTMLDIIACPVEGCTNDAFAFESLGRIAIGPLTGTPFFLGGDSFGETLEAFEAARYSLTPVSAVVPLPATALLLLGALVGLGAVRAGASLGAVRA